MLSEKKKAEAGNKTMSAPPKSSRTHGESPKHHAEFGCDREGFSENDTIVPTDLANSTGNAIFDDTLKIALNVPAAIAFPESGARRLQRFPHPLETCKPRHPHPEGSQSEHVKVDRSVTVCRARATCARVARDSAFLTFSST
jgi:hypothetical protein